MRWPLPPLTPWKRPRWSQADRMATGGPVCRSEPPAEKGPGAGVR